MLKLLKKFTKTEWLLACVAFVFIVLQVWMDLTIPDYMSEITTLVQTEGSAMGDILTAEGKCWLCPGKLCRFRGNGNLRGQDCLKLFLKPQRPAVSPGTILYYGRDRQVLYSKSDYPVPPMM